MIYETLGERLDVIDLDTGMGSLGGAELVLSAEMDLHVGASEPHAAAAEFFGPGYLVEAERVPVEDAGSVLAAGRHGDLDVVDAHHPDCRR